MSSKLLSGLSGRGDLILGREEGDLMAHDFVDLDAIHRGGMAGAERSSSLREEDVVLPDLERKSDVLDEEAKLSDDVIKEILPECFPSRPRKYVHHEDDDCFGLDSGSSPVYHSEAMTVERKITKNEHFDVISLLSWAPNGMPNFLTNRDGVKVDARTLKNKYVVVCCVFLPLHYTFHYPTLRLLRALFGVAAAADCPFQLVIVPKLRPRFDSPLVIQPFLDALPSTCLLIPYERVISCDHVCHSLHLCRHLCLGGLIVDPYGTVLQTSFHFLHQFGIDAFPFTDSRIDFLVYRTNLLRGRLDHIYRETRMIRLQRVSRPAITLDELLQCDQSLQLCHYADKNKTVSVSELRQRHVGLYLFHDGNVLREISKLNLDILIIPLAFLNPVHSLSDNIYLELGKYSKSSWWLFPYDDRVCRQLCTLSLGSSSDQLLIVPPADQGISGELEGMAVTRCYGADEPPFTRAVLLEKNFKRLKNLTLNQLFPRDNLNSEEPQLDISKLEGKEVFICLNDNSPFCPWLLDYVLKIRHTHPDSVFVYVPPKSYEGVKLDDLPPLDWQVSRSCLNDVLSVFYYKGESFSGTTIVACKDGQIFSREAQYHLDEHGAFRFDGYSLRSEILSHLANLDMYYD